MTKEQLARWRELGFSFDDFYDNVAVDAPKKSLSIKFVSSKMDMENYYFQFSINAVGLKKDKADIFITEINRVFKDNLLDTSSRTITLSPNGTSNYMMKLNKDIFQNLSSSFEFGGFEFKAFLTCDTISAETSEFKLDVKGPETTNSCKLTEPKKEESNPLSLTEKQKAEFISTIIAETNNGDKELWDIAWIYFNLVTHLGVEKGLSRSSAYKKKLENYKICMFYLGQGSEYTNEKMKTGNTIGSWTESDYFKNGLKKKIDLFKQYTENNIFIAKPLNLYPKWYGQGYWKDLNLTGEKDKAKWFQARVYFRLQQQCKVKVRYIKILEDRFNTSFIFDEDNIIKFFKDNPDLLPKEKSKVIKFDYDDDSDK